MKKVCELTPDGAKYRIVCKRVGEKIKVYPMRITTEMQERGRQLAQHPKAKAARECIRASLGDKRYIRNCMRHCLGGTTMDDFNKCTAQLNECSKEVKEGKYQDIDECMKKIS